MSFIKRRDFVILEGIFGVIAFVILSLVGDGVTTMILAYTIGFVLVGLIIGAIVSYFKYR